MARLGIITCLITDSINNGFIFGYQFKYIIGKNFILVSLYKVERKEGITLEFCWLVNEPRLEELATLFLSLVVKLIVLP